MKKLFWALALMLSFLLTHVSHAAESQAIVVPASATAGQAVSVGAVKLQLLRQLESDGFLSGKLADEARQKYVTREDLATVSGATVPEAGPSFWDRALTWTNFFYVLGVIALLVAFGGWIARIAAMFIRVIRAVPEEVYQAAFLGAGLLLTLNTLLPVGGLFSTSHGFYLALFGSLANLIVLGWVMGSHPELPAALLRMLPKWFPMGALLAAGLMLYFGALALAYHSEIFGFMAAVAFSGMMTFTISYRPGVLFMDFEDKALPAVVLGNLAALIGYSVLKLTGHLPVGAELFEVGLTYYCSIAMGVGFLVGASPFEWRSASPSGYLLLFILVLLSSVYAYVFHDFKVVGSIMCVFAALLALEWHAKLCMRAGFVGGMFLLGVALVGLSVAMEHYSYLLVLRTAD